MITEKSTMKQQYNIEDTPTVFATSRFTFPYTLVGRPFPDLNNFPVNRLSPGTIVTLHPAVKIRTEFFGAICFKHLLQENSPYGYITYLNKLGALILHYCDGRNTIADIHQKLNTLMDNRVTLAALIQYIAKLLSTIAILKIVEQPLQNSPSFQPDLTLWQGGVERLSAPLRLYLNITKRCNLRCKHCYADAGRGSSDFDRAVLDRILKEALDLKIPSIVLIGGEPLLYKDFVGLVKNANAMELSVVTATNAMLINEQRAAELREAGLKVISISVDGADEESHDYIRGKGSYQKTFLGVKNCVNAGIKVTISSTFTSRTIDEVSLLIDRSVDKGATDFQLMVFSPVGRGKEEKELTPSDESIIRLKETLEGCLTKYPQITINCTGAIIPKTLNEWQQNFLADPIAKFVYTGCEAARFRCEVSFEGYIIPCILLNYEQFRGGHIDTHTIQAVWRNSPVFQQLGDHRQLHKGVACTTCPGYDDCRGGCRGVIYSNYEDLSREYPTCSLRG